MFLHIASIPESRTQVLSLSMLILLMWCLVIEGFAKTSLTACLHCSHTDFVIAISMMCIAAAESA
jgi:hypothetical protein